LCVHRVQGESEEDSQDLRLVVRPSFVLIGTVKIFFWFLPLFLFFVIPDFIDPFFFSRSKQRQRWQDQKKKERTSKTGV